jgi:hypothetical protein
MHQSDQGQTPWTVTVTATAEGAGGRVAHSARLTGEHLDALERLLRFFAEPQAGECRPPAVDVAEAPTKVVKTLAGVRREAVGFSGPDRKRHDEMLS